MQLLLLNAWFALLLALTHLHARIEMHLEVRLLIRKHQLLTLRRRVPHPPVSVRGRRAPQAVLPPSGPDAAVEATPAAPALGVDERALLASQLHSGIRAAVQRNQPTLN